MIPLLCLCGPSAAGKTSITRTLQDRLERDGIRVLPLSCDDYYWHEWSPDAVYGYDTPAGIDAETLLVDLEKLCRGNATSLRRYDMVSHRARRDPLNQAYDLLVLEGAFGPQLLLGEPLLRSLVYLELTMPLRLWRRLRRDRRERGHSLTYVIRQTVLETLPGEREFIRPLKQKADLVIQNSTEGLATLTQHARSLVSP